MRTQLRNCEICADERRCFHVVGERHKLWVCYDCRNTYMPDAPIVTRACKPATPSPMFRIWFVEINHASENTIVMSRARKVAPGKYDIQSRLHLYRHITPASESRLTRALFRLCTVQMMGHGYRAFRNV